MESKAEKHILLGTVTKLFLRDSDDCAYKKRAHALFVLVLLNDLYTVLLFSSPSKHAYFAHRHLEHRDNSRKCFLKRTYIFPTYEVLTSS